MDDGVRLNRAAAVAEAYVEALRARDWDALRATLSEDFTREDRRSVMSNFLTGRDNHVAGWKALTDQGISEFHVGPVATRGEHLCIYGGHIATADGFEIGALELFETDDNHLIRHVIFLEADDHAGAERGLDERSSRLT